MEDCWLAVQPLVRSQTLTHHHKLASQQCLWTASITVPAKYETYLPGHYSSRRTKTTSAGFWREQLPIISELPWRAEKFAILATVWGNISCGEIRVLKEQQDYSRVKLKPKSSFVKLGSIQVISESQERSSSFPSSSFSNAFLQLHFSNFVIAGFYSTFQD